MSQIEYTALASFALGILLGWFIHAMVLQIGYRLGIVRWVGIGASTKEGGNGA